MFSSMSKSTSQISSFVFHVLDDEHDRTAGRSLRKGPADVSYEEEVIRAQGRERESCHHE
jgi:hypothetical protein